MCKCSFVACGLVHHQRVQRLRHHLRPWLSSQLKGFFGRAATWLRDFEALVCESRLFQMTSMCALLGLCLRSPSACSASVFPAPCFTVTGTGE
jgi:hypothetical protein